MKVSPWQTILLDYDRTTEFTGDDVDQYSALCDLGDYYENVLLIIPTIDSSTVGIAVQMNGNIDTVPVILHILDDDATGSFLQATTAATTTITIAYRIGGVQHFRVKCGSNQTANRTFYARGF